MAIGKLLLFLGIGLTLLGLLVIYAPGLLQWFGRLPGDIRIEDENRFIFFPITSMLVISAIITLLVNVFFRR